MNWFTGNIAEAVALSKAKNSIFVVYCEGNLMLKLNTSCLHIKQTLIYLVAYLPIPLIMHM